MQGWPLQPTQPNLLQIRTSSCQLNDCLSYRPLGVVHLTLEDVRLKREQIQPESIVFLVLKCGPHWGRTQAMNSTSSMPINWEVRRHATRKALAGQSEQILIQWDTEADLPLGRFTSRSTILTPC